MAYLHCHGCDWSQDDFWHKGYNPISLMWKDFWSNIKPRKVRFDKWFYIENKLKVKDYTWSWWMIYWNWKRHFKRFFTQKVWTYKKWEKVRKDWKCPECGSNNWDID